MLKIDLHVHTIASGHAHCTILEYIQQAKKLKMKTIGITEHGPGSSEALVSYIYFRELGRIPKIIDGIRVLKGAEANIINIKGELDLDDETLERLDYVMANIHPTTPYKNKGEKINTQTIIKTIKSGKINILTHPFVDKGMPSDIKKISEAACKNNVLLEIDTAYLSERRINEKMLLDLKIMIDMVKKYNQKIIIGTDSHNIWELGNISGLDKFKKKIGLADELIINNYPEKLFKLLKIDEK
jgi:putative hydrolase